MLREKMDKKFDGDVFKVKDSTHVSEDQWIVFLAKDTAFAEYALPAYLNACRILGADEKQVEMVEAMIARVNQWREAHPHRCKVPDAIGEKTL